ncbi:MAG: Hpt domain-containing protein, partial [Chloroflexi bacterium]|nr:Hpt domain-containing protein [Chloroflexota bacterium]
MPTAFDRATILSGFAEEVREYLPRIRNGIGSLATNVDEVDPDVVEECYRYAHTIKSASSMVGCTALADVARPLEEALIAIGDGTLRADPAVTAALERCLGRLARLTDGLPRGESGAAIVAENTADFATLYAAAGGQTAAGDRTSPDPFWPAWNEQGSGVGGRGS